jgi:chromate transporter
MTRPTPLQAAAWWFKLGCLSFGGPAGQIALMHAELVERRCWIGPKRFAHALQYCMLLPGPEAQQLATYLGWLLHGPVGGIIAGTLFILPGLAVMLTLATVYVAFGQTPVIAGLFSGLQPAIVGVIVVSLLRMGSRVLATRAALAIAAAALAARFAEVPFPAIVAGAAVLGLVLPTRRPSGGDHHAGHGGGAGPRSADEPAPAALIDDDHPRLVSRRRLALEVGLAAIIGIALAAGSWLAIRARFGADGVATEMAEFFTRAALVTFGGAYAVLPYVADRAVVTHGWVTRAQMLDGLALGESTPGPLILVLSFVGFVGGHERGAGGWAGAWTGGLIATWFTFLPSFVFILAGAPLIEATRGWRRLSAALDGVSAAVVAALAGMAWDMARAVLAPGGLSSSPLAWSPKLACFGIDPIRAMFALTAVALLRRFSRPVHEVILAAGVLGVAAALFGRPI